MKYFLIFWTLIPAAVCKAQTVSPSIIAAAGDVNKAAGISLEWTLGEPVIESLTATDRLYTQGFHQPLLVAKNFKSASQPLLAGYRVSVAPNPVQSVLSVTIISPNEEKLLFTLIDMTGRRFPVQPVPGGVSTRYIDMTGKIPGIYILEVRQASGQLINSFKIIKAQ